MLLHHSIGYLGNRYFKSVVLTVKILELWYQQGSKVFLFEQYLCQQLSRVEKIAVLDSSSRVRISFEMNTPYVRLSGMLVLTNGNLTMETLKSSRFHRILLLILQNIWFGKKIKLCDRLRRACCVFNFNLIWIYEMKLIHVYGKFFLKGKTYLILKW